MTRALLGLAVLLAGCMDLAGPRPRPGAPQDQPATEAAKILYWELQPRVISQGTTDSVRITVTLDGPADLVYVEPRNGTAVPLAHTSGNSYSARLASATMLFGYRIGDLRSVVGFIKATTGAVTEEQALLVNVKDATVPTITPSTVSLGMQAGTHVVNMRYDSLHLGGRFPPNVMKAFYTQFTDAYTFASVIEQVVTPKAPYLTIARNPVRGLGMVQFDNGAPYGSSAVLEAILDFPDETQFDPAQGSNLRELSHRWMNFSNITSLQPGKPSWPLSDLANGMVGWADPQTGELLVFPFSVTAQSNGTYTLNSLDARSYNDLELYLMGLLPADSVAAHLVFLNQNQRFQVRNTGVLQGPVDTITAAKWIAREGARSPAYAVAQRQFRMVTIVLSRGGLLSRDELSFYDHVASRGERQEGLAYFNGATRGVTQPFYTATGGRGLLITTLAPR